MHENHKHGEHDLMTCEEAATYLRLHVRTVGRLLTQGKLPGVKVGRQWRLRRADLDAYLRAEPRQESTS
jgi:excisionase family DNA binding protein